MKKFTIYEGYVEIILLNNRPVILYLDENSGKIYFRYKIGSPSRIKHTGVYIGTDINGVRYFVHNHYETKKPSLVTKLQFSKGWPLQEYPTRITNPPTKIVENALEQVLIGKEYNWINYNCQTLVNVAASNQHISEDVGRIVAGLLAGVFIVAIIKSL